MVQSNSIATQPARAAQSYLAMYQYGDAGQVDDRTTTSDGYSTPSRPVSLKETLVSNCDIPPNEKDRVTMSDAQSTPVQNGGSGDFAADPNRSDWVLEPKPLPGWRYALLGLG